MDNKILEIFIPGPAGRLEAKYYKSKKNTSPIALVLQPHPQYGGTMNNKVVVETFHAFMDNGFSVGVHQSLTDNAIDYVICKINDFVGEKTK